DRAQGPARPAPGGPEIDQDRDVAADDLGLPVVGRELVNVRARHRENSSGPGRGRWPTGVVRRPVSVSQFVLACIREANSAKDSGPGIDTRHEKAPVESRVDSCPIPPKGLEIR